MAARNFEPATRIIGVGEHSVVRPGTTGANLRVGTSAESIDLKAALQDGVFERAFIFTESGRAFIAFSTENGKGSLLDVDQIKASGDLCATPIDLGKSKLVAGKLFKVAALKGFSKNVSDRVQEIVLEHSRMYTAGESDAIISDSKMFRRANETFRSVDLAHLQGGWRQLSAQPPVFHVLGQVHTPDRSIAYRVGAIKQTPDRYIDLGLSLNSGDVSRVFFTTNSGNTYILEPNNDGKTGRLTDTRSSKALKKPVTFQVQLDGLVVKPGERSTVILADGSDSILTSSIEKVVLECNKVMDRSEAQDWTAGATDFEVKAAERVMIEVASRGASLG